MFVGCGKQQYWLPQIQQVIDREYPNLFYTSKDLNMLMFNIK